MWPPRPPREHCIYTDHHVHGDIIRGSRLREIDCLTVDEDGRRKTADDLLLERARDVGRVMFSMDYVLVMRAQALKRFGLIAALAAAITGVMLAIVLPVRSWTHDLILHLEGKKSVADRVAEFGAARARVHSAFVSAGVDYPPQRVVLVGLKDEMRLEVYAGRTDGDLTKVMAYPVLAASGHPGPKLRAGDGQVPEGVYGVDSLNPNSGLHVALRIAYPNKIDRDLAAREGRSDLGGDIMIHGGAESVGCIAIGDPASEDLFVLAATIGVQNVEVVITPVDLRTRPLPADLAMPRFADRYQDIRNELSRCRCTTKSGVDVNGRD